jgi:hypothetical protein
MPITVAVALLVSFSHHWALALLAGAVTAVVFIAVEDEQGAAEEAKFPTARAAESSAPNEHA